MSGRCSAPILLFLQLCFRRCLERFEVWPELFLGFFVHPVNEENPLEMIGFMLDGAREESAAAEFNWLAFLIHGLDFDAIGPGDFSENLRKTETTFRALDRIAQGLQLRINQNQRHKPGYVSRMAF